MVRSQSLAPNLLGAELGFTSPPPTCFLWLSGILIVYFLLTQAVKLQVIRKYGYG